MTEDASRRRLGWRGLTWFWWRVRTLWSIYGGKTRRGRVWFLFFMCFAAWAVPAWLVPHRPPVGVYIAIMGLVIALMALPKEPSGIEKFLWIIIITGLMFAEIKNIYRTDVAQVQTFQSILGGLKETNEGLQGTARGIRDAVQGISTTSSKISAVGDLAKQNLENVTGGRSFAAVTPQVWSGLVPMPLTIYNYGKQTLTGVTVTIRGPEAWDFLKNPRNPYSMYEAEASAINVGTLHPREMKVLSHAISPTVQGLKEGNSEVAQYQLDISAQNFTVTEYLLFKKGVRVPWDFKYTVTRQFIKSQSRKETKFGYETLATTDWTGN